MQNLKPLLANPLDNITRIEYKGQPVLTTEQLAEVLSSKGDRVVTTASISANFKNNESHFIEGVHYFVAEGEELEILRSKNFGLQISPKSRRFYMWTKRGCARHCKSVNSEVAWDVYEALEDRYFNPVIDRDKPLESVSDFERGKALVGVAQAARDPYTKKRLVAKAANLILGEEFIPVPDLHPVVQVTLFK